jgi:phosphopantothenoylcysteine decarboxylase/phosphopantothenate--cysteine ligase
MKKYNVLICVTGGIAAYKIPKLCREFIKNDFNVKVLMTGNATKFITPLTFEAVVGSKVYVDEFEGGDGIEFFEHINLADWANVIIIAPATANTIAKIAHGIGDNLLTSLMLVAFEKPTFICPSMNVRMYENPITQQNIKILNERGYYIIEPDEGELACGDKGRGRLKEAENIYKIVNEYLNSAKSFKDIKFTVTAGPTIEYIDPVRYISNRSSGKMGIAIADYASKNGGNVLLVGNISSIKTGKYEHAHIESATEMLSILKDHIAKYDILIMAAAVADFKVKEKSQEKIKKGRELILELEENPDILKELSKLKREGQVFVGFAAESGDYVENAKKKLIDKNLDLIVFNNILREDIGFDSDYNEVVLIFRNNDVLNIPKMQKSEIASIIVDKAVEIYRSKNV